jgi:PST family polysaccharide transporter
MNAKSRLSGMDAPERLDLQGLRALSVRSGFISVSTQTTVALLQLATTMVLARILEPSDFGVIGMILAITAFADVFRDLGLSNAVVQAKSLSHAQHSNLFWLNVGAGAALSAIVAAIAPAVSWFYGNHSLQALTWLLSGMFIVTALGTQHAALMQREMRFGPQMASYVCGSVAMASVSIGLGIAGFGYWALALGTLAGATTTTGLLAILSGFRPSMYHRSVEVRSFLRLGGDVMGFNLVNYIHRNLDNILIGRSAGAAALGIYSRAYQLSMFPINLLRGPIMAVAFPAMSRLSEHDDEFRLYVIRSSSLVAFATMPLTAFMAVSAHPIIILALGQKWAAAAQLFAILAVAGFVAPTAGMRGTIMLAKGRSRAYLAWGAVNAATMSVAFLIGIQWGSLGVVVAYCIVTYVLLLPSLLFAFRETTIKLGEFISATHRPIVASMLAGAAVLALASEIDATSPVRDLAVRFAIFTSAYFAMLALLPGGVADLRHKIGLIKVMSKVTAGDLPS